jgi:hypothetical protein
LSVAAARPIPTTFGTIAISEFEGKVVEGVVGKVVEGVVGKVVEGVVVVPTVVDSDRLDQAVLGVEFDPLAKTTHVATPAATRQDNRATARLALALIEPMILRKLRVVA